MCPENSMVPDSDPNEDTVEEVCILEALVLQSAIIDALKWELEAEEQLPGSVPADLQEYPQWFFHVGEFLMDMNAAIEAGDEDLIAGRVKAGDPIYERLQELIVNKATGVGSFWDIRDPKLGQALERICNYWSDGLERRLLKIQQMICGQN